MRYALRVGELSDEQSEHSLNMIDGISQFYCLFPF